MGDCVLILTQAAKPDGSVGCYIPEGVIAASTTEAQKANKKRALQALFFVSQKKSVCLRPPLSPAVVRSSSECVSG